MACRREMYALTVRFGIENGIFEAEGLDLRMKVVFGGPEIAAAFDSGEVADWQPWLAIGDQCHGVRQAISHHRQRLSPEGPYVSWGA